MTYFYEFKKTTHLLIWPTSYGLTLYQLSSDLSVTSLMARLIYYVYLREQSSDDSSPPAHAHKRRKKKKRRHHARVAMSPDHSVGGSISPPYPQHRHRYIEYTDINFVILINYVINFFITQLKIKVMVTYVVVTSLS